MSDLETLESFLEGIKEPAVKQRITDTFIILLKSDVSDYFPKVMRETNQMEKDIRERGLIESVGERRINKAKIIATQLRLVENKNNIIQFLKQGRR